MKRTLEEYVRDFSGQVYKSGISLSEIDGFIDVITENVYENAFNRSPRQVLNMIKTACKKYYGYDEEER